MKIKNREKLLTMAAVLVIVLLVGDRLVLSPLTTQWKNRKDEIARLTIANDNGDILIQREKGIRDLWSNMKSNALPTVTSIAESKVAESVVRWTQTSRIGFAGMKRQWKPGDEDYYQTLECQVDAVGNMQSLARFLYELETDPLALRIEEMEIAARDNGGQLLSLAVRFTGLLLNPEQK